MCSINFPLITSMDTGTGMLVKRKLTSKNIRVPSGAIFCSLRGSAKPLLLLINEKLFPHYSWRIWVSNLASARSKLQLIIIRKGTNQAEKSRRDWRRCNGIRLLQGSVQFQCLKLISEDGVQALFEVSNSLIQTGIILTPWFQGKMG